MKRKRVRNTNGDKDIRKKGKKRDGEINTEVINK
jgi:hypothetical protein